MNGVTRILRNGLALAVLLAGISCGGGDPPSSGTAPVAADSNVVPVIVDSGPLPTTNPTTNTLYTTVTFCVPGSTTECQTIDHIQVDTGSSGLRVLSKALSLTLPVTQVSSNQALVECTQFVDGYSWGPIALADIQVGGESAGSVPIQVIGDPNFSLVPDSCSGENPMGTAEDTVASFGANGIVGIGFLAQDCPACATNASNGFYYSCTAAGDCVGTTVAVGSQAQNPVTLFATDNNGTIIDLPAVTSPGAATVTGSLIFGIDTQANNASGTQTVLTVDSVYGYFTTLIAGQSLIDSFIDSGSNGIFFNDSNITTCSDVTYFYCPAATLGFSATLTGQNGVSATDSFTVDNADTLASNSTFAVLPTLAGTYASDPDGFDWGLPFYYGRRVATAIQGQPTSVGTGPYVAF